MPSCKRTLSLISLLCLAAASSAITPLTPRRVHLSRSVTKIRAAVEGRLNYPEAIPNGVCPRDLNSRRSRAPHLGRWIQHQMVARGLQIKKLGNTPWVQHFRKTLSHIPWIFASLLAIYRPWGIDWIFFVWLIFIPPGWNSPCFHASAPALFLIYRVIPFKRVITFNNDCRWAGASHLEHVQEMIGLVLETNCRQWTILRWHIQHLPWSSMEIYFLSSLPITQA